MDVSFILIFLAVVFLFGLQNSRQAVGFKKLQEFLPKIDLAGFARQKPAGETTFAFNLTTSEAHITYEKGSSDNLISIEVKIADIAGIPFGQMGTSMIGMMEFENETENGYEKSIQVQGFKGIEKVDRSEDNKSAEIQLAVGNRFLFFQRRPKSSSTLSTSSSPR